MTSQLPLPLSSNFARKSDGFIVTARIGDQLCIPSESMYCDSVRGGIRAEQNSATLSDGEPKHSSVTESWLAPSRSVWHHHRAQNNMRNALCRVGMAHLSHICEGCVASSSSERRAVNSRACACSRAPTLILMANNAVAVF